MNGRVPGAELSWLWAPCGSSSPILDSGCPRNTLFPMSPCLPVRWGGTWKAEACPSLPSCQLHCGHRPGEQRPGLEVPEVLPGAGVLQPSEHPLPLRGLRLLLHGGQEVLRVLLQRGKCWAFRLLWVVCPSVLGIKSNDLSQGLPPVRVAAGRNYAPLGRGTHL